MRRSTLNLGYINVLACVELEGGLRAVHFKVQLGVWVAELRETAQWQATRVERNFRRIGLHDKDVIDVRLLGAQREWGSHVARELVDGADRDAGGVDREVVGGCELGGGARHRRAAGKVEVAVMRSEQASISTWG